MKKYLSIVLAVLLLLTFAGCGELEHKTDCCESSESTQNDCCESTAPTYESDIPDCCGG